MPRNSVEVIHLQTINIMFTFFENLVKPFPEEIPNSPNLKVPRGTISFENIRFHYGKQTGAIDHLSLKISLEKK
jgi:ABC-type bacteriocin/lantibiotic exporter with double-glycine peptidase domain